MLIFEALTPQRKKNTSNFFIFRLTKVRLFPFCLLKECSTCMLQPISVYCRCSFLGRDVLYISIVTTNNVIYWSWHLFFLFLFFYNVLWGWWSQWTWCEAAWVMSVDTVGAHTLCFLLPHAALWWGAQPSRVLQFMFYF